MSFAQYLFYGIAEFLCSKYFCPVKKIQIFLALFVMSCGMEGQVITHEDSLNAGLTPKNNPTVLSGYGQAKVEYDMRYKTGAANLTRNVMFLGHRFSNTISFFSELELENAKVANGNVAGEISMEQLFLKFNVNRSNYIVAGLFIPRIGIINENHLPTTFNSNDRPYVEQFVIPATWRELGIGFYGQIPSIPGLNYSASLVNGLSSANFTHGSGLVNGRYEGSNATASNLAVHGALLYYVHHFRIQASTYFGGSNGVTKKTGDSLNLDYGAFGTPVSLSEFNIQYLNPLTGIQFKALASYVKIKDADRINAAYANNTPGSMYGYYAEIGYNVFHLIEGLKTKSMVVFARYEAMDLNASLPENGKADGFMQKQYLVAGLHYQPIKGVSVKLDYVRRITGEYNKLLYNVNPYATNLPFYTTADFINIGIGYSF